MIQAVMINAFIRNGTTDDIGNLFHIFCGIAHGNAGACSFQHFNVIGAVAEGDCLIFRQSIVGQYFSDSHTLAAVGRDDVCGTVPPGCYFCTRRVLYKQVMIFCAAAQHNLVNLILRKGIEIFCHINGLFGNRKIVCKIIIYTVGSHPVFAGESNRTADGCGVFNDLLYIGSRNRIA